MYQWQVRNDFNKDVYVYIFVRLMQFFKLNMKDNWEPPVGEIKLWEYRCVFVGILYRYDLITKCFHLNEIMIINILCISFLLSGVPDYFYRNKISSGGDLSHYSSASLY